MQVEITKWTLETRHRSPLASDPPIVLRRAIHPNPDLNRFFYATVGRDWLWHTRLPWSDDEWLAVIDRPSHETWIGYLDDSPVGYVEIDRADPATVEIEFFGLLPAFVGRGLGGPMLAVALDEAWRPAEVSSVWLHTCSLDHPRALPNYLAAGFEVVRTEQEIDDIPDDMVAARVAAGRPL
ncbi:MAG: GNAT family N-acetyltransferase [Actinomycetota bacterium]